MQIMGVEQIDIRGPAGTLTCCAKGNLAQSAQLLETPRDLRGAGILNTKVSAADQDLLQRQRLDFRFEQSGRNRRRDIFMSGSGKRCVLEPLGNEERLQPAEALLQGMGNSGEPI